MLTAIIFWVVVGLIAGVIAKLIMPGRDPGGFIVTIIIGIVGAVIGGWILTALGFGPDGGVLGSIIAGVIGAVILLRIYRAMARRDRVYRPCAFMWSRGCLGSGSFYAYEPL